MFEFEKYGIFLRVMKANMSFNPDGDAFSESVNMQPSDVKKLYRFIQNNYDTRGW